MTDKIAKLISKLSPKQLVVVQGVLDKLYRGDTDNLDIKSLVGHKDLYRVRVDNFRIVFKVSGGKDIKIILIAKRNERTYKNL